MSWTALAVILLFLTLLLSCVIYVGRKLKLLDKAAQQIVEEVAERVEVMSEGTGERYGRKLKRDEGS